MRLSFGERLAEYTDNKRELAQTSSQESIPATACDSPELRESTRYHQYRWLFNTIDLTALSQCPASSQPIDNTYTDATQQNRAGGRDGLRVRDDPCTKGAGKDTTAIGSIIRK